MSVEFLPEELIAQVLSYLPVKSLMQLRCVCKAWNSLLSHPKFIKLHFRQSKQNIQIICESFDFSFLPFPLNTLLNNPSTIKSTKNCFPFPSPADYFYQFIGSCNGLFCFLLKMNNLGKCIQNTWFQLWNPATNTLSNKFGHQSYPLVNQHPILRCSAFSFGYHNSTDTYKCVYFRPNKLEIFTFGGSLWKIIQLPHIVPLEHSGRVPSTRSDLSEALYLNDTINLLARDIAKQILIISLNLGTDTYCRLLPPQDFVEVSIHLPTIHVLEDSLCFSHHTQNTHFIIWKMTQFGIENSWTQFLKINYLDLDIHIDYKYFLAPLCLFENGIALVQASNNHRLQVILYHWGEKRIEKTRMQELTMWMFNQNHVESLAPTDSKLYALK
ncbi:F-box/kelch-repeat protein At3g23880 isoform X2 [Lathyrus oleraceus]|uniref:F-box/kelch-repeat protein At3g23880 isoform X2 n=1 Tax=Pisum sativum TaxID=3888 RepID=UPI0021D1A660|nr:F-box/kelch-repeat protein At3g23880-like isoform X2 [Pisum sativum]